MKIIFLMIILSCGTLISQDNFIYGFGLNSSGQLGLKVWDSEINSPEQVSNIYTWKKISAGGYHSLAIKDDGTLWLWGENRFGQLGDGTLIGKNSIQRINADKDWKDVAGGNHHSLAIKEDGTLWAWGLNDSGQLGDGSIEDQSYPLKVGYDSDWKSVFSRFNSSFAIKEDGTLWAWGLNDSGQLGDGTKVNKSTPVQIGSENDWVKIAVGEFYSIGLKSDNSLWAWGQNNVGQLGIGNNNPEMLEPMQLVDRYIDVACGVFHTIAIQTDGTLWAWGNGDVGKLGNGSQGGEISWPIQIGSDSDWEKVACGSFHSVGLKTNGNLYTWGENNESQLGNGGGNDDDKSIPTLISSGMEWNDIVAGAFHNIAFSTTSNIPFYSIQGSIQKDGVGIPDIDFKVGKYIANTNNNGEFFLIGLEEGYYDIVPLDASLEYDEYRKMLYLEGTEVINFTANDKPGYYIYSFGYNNSGQLGDGTNEDKYTPVIVDSNKVWNKISAGEEHTIAIRNDGTLWSWGNNIAGQLGNNTDVNESRPIQVGSDNDWRAISCGGFHNLALKTDGTLWAWGSNGGGQVGDFTVDNKFTPVQIGTDNDWDKIYAGGDHSLALKYDGSLWVWGLNDLGQLGDDTGGQIMYRLTPKRVGVDVDWDKIYAGDHFTVIIRDDKFLFAAGANSDGQLGDGTQDNNDALLQIGGDNDWNEVACGSLFVIALKTDNSLWGWGDNIDSQLGIENTDNQLIPIRIGTENNWEKVGSGFYHSIAIKTDSTIWTTGYNGHGALGREENSETFTQLGEDSDWVDAVGGAFHTVTLKNSLIKETYTISGNILENGNGVQGIAVSNGSSTVSTNALGEYKFEGLEAGSYTLTPIDNNFNFNPEYSEINLVEDVVLEYFDAERIFNSNELYLHSWGNNDLGQLALGNNNNRNKPTAVSNEKDWHFISSYYNSSLGVKSDGTLWAWGLNEDGQLGLGDNVNRNEPTQVGTDNDWDRVATGKYHTLAIKRNGTLWSWGSNENGKLGLGDEIDRNTPTQVGSDNDWVFISAGAYQSLAIKSDGTLWAWGDNGFSVLGTGDDLNRNVPTLIGFENNWYLVSAGEFHTVGIKYDGTIWSWGSNGAGQLGQNDFFEREIPTQVETDNNWSFIDAGGEFTIATKQDGTLWSWGRNFFSQLGLGDKVDRGNPNQVGTDTDWVFISANNFHVLALKQNGSLWGWGSNTFGQLGFANFNEIQTPTMINNDSDWRYVEAGEKHSFAKKETKIEYFYSISGKLVNTDGVGLYAIEISNGSSTITTDIQGNYEFLNLAEGSYTITPTDITYKFTPEFYEIDLTKDTMDINFLGEEIINEFTIAGIVSENGVGLERIVLSDGSSTVNTNVVGEYFFSNLEMGSYTITPINSNYTFNPEYREINLTQDEFGVDFDADTIINTYSIIGKVTENGVGLEGIEISNGNTSLFTNNDGDYIFENLTIGSYTITPINSNYTFTPEYREINLTEDEFGVDFAADTIIYSYSISGRVIEEGVGLEGIELSNGNNTVTTDANGDYLFSNLNQGNYIITPITTGYIYSPINYNIDLSRDTTEFNFVATNNNNVNYSLSGRVIDQNNNPLANVKVDFGNSRIVLTNALGEYFYNFVNENYNVFYSLNGYEFLPNNVDFTINNNDLILDDVIGTKLNINDCIEADEVDMGTTVYNSLFRTELIENIKIVNQCSGAIVINDLYLDALSSDEFEIISQQQLPVSLQANGIDTISITVRYIPKNLGRDIGKIVFETDQAQMQTLVVANAIEFDANTKVSYIRLRPSANQVENGDNVKIFLEVYDQQNIFQPMEWTLDIGMDARLAAGLRFFYNNGSAARAQEVFLNENINLKEYNLKGNYNPSDDSLLGHFEFVAALAETDTLQIRNGSFKWLTDSIVVKPAFEDFVHIIPCDVDGKRLLKRNNGLNTSFINSIYPRPTAGKITLNMKAKEDDVINIIGMEGTTFKSIKLEKDMDNEDLEIFLDDLNNGVYIIELNSKGNSTTEKIIIRK